MTESLEHEAVRGVLGGWVAGSVEIIDTVSGSMSGTIYGNVKVKLSRKQWQKFKADRETPGTEAYRARRDGVPGGA